METMQKSKVLMYSQIIKICPQIRLIVDNAKRYENMNQAYNEYERCKKILSKWVGFSAKDEELRGEQPYNAVLAVLLDRLDL